MARKKRRVRRSKTSKPKEVTLLYCNVNGLKSKQDSVRDIITRLSPQIIIFCETKLPSDQVLKKLLPEYEINCRPTKSGQSGLAIAVKNQTFNSVLDVTSTSHNNILSTRIGVDTQAIRIILGYAPQENDSVEAREHFFTELEVEVSEAKLADEMTLLIGDMNAKIEQQDQLTASSQNGKLLMELVNSQELDIVNFDSRCTGKWTHVVRTTGAPSVLDYLIISKDLQKYLTDVTIDEDCVFCPFGVKKKKGKITPQYSDHNAIIGKLKISYTKKRIQKQSSWRLTEEGLQNFHNITEDNEYPTSIEGTGKECYNKFEKIITDTMNQCFQKTKQRKAREIHRDHSLLYRKAVEYGRRGKAQRKVARTYIQAMLSANIESVAKRNSEAVKTTLNNLTVDNDFSPNNFWELCKKSRRNNNTMGNSVITEKGNEVFGSDMIKDTYMKEFQHRLRERSIIPELKNYESRTKQLVKLYVEKSKKTITPNYTTEELDQVTAKVKKKKSCGRDCIPPEITRNWGGNLKTLALNVMNKIKNNHVIPSQWLEVLISTIYKNKGSKKMLVNQRGIFLKQILSKIFEKINMKRIQENINRISPLQAGSRANRSPADQTFLLRGCIDHAKYMNRPAYIVLYDYSQCFDSLWLDDCLLSLWKLGVQNEILSLIRDLNKDCNIIVKTPVGPTEEFTVHNIVQQGSVCGGVLCSASTGEVPGDIEIGGTQIGTTMIQVLIYVDDIATINNNIQDVYYSHERVKWFSVRKRLSLNGGKCILLCVNLRPTDVVPRLFIDGKLVPTKEAAAYLGDDFNAKGNNSDLIDERVRKGKSCIANAMALCSEITMGFYAIQTLFLLYKSLFLQIVLNNAQSWTNITAKEHLSLQRIQLKYIKRIFHAPSSTSNALTFLETGTLPIKYEIHVKQLTYLHHILTLNHTDPVRKMYQQQLCYPALNWGNEIKQLRETYSINESDEEITFLSKESWKKLVKEKVRAQALIDLNEEAKMQEKAQSLLPYTELRIQPYITNLTPPLARKIFHIRTGTIDLRSVRKYKYGTNTLCRMCSVDNETVYHIVNECPQIARNEVIENIFTSNIEELQEIAERCVEFEKKVDAKEKENITVG